MVTAVLQLPIISGQLGHRGSFEDLRPRPKGVRRPQPERIHRAARNGIARQFADKRLQEFEELVQSEHTLSERHLSLLVITDVLGGNSWIHPCEPAGFDGLVREAFSQGQADPCANWVSAPGVVSRKKQIVPQLIAALAST